MKFKLSCQILLGTIFIGLLFARCKQCEQKPAEVFAVLSPDEVSSQKNMLPQFSIKMGTESSILKGGCKGHDELQNVELPKSYMGRDFLHRVSNTYDIFDYAGKIFYWDSTTQVFIRVSPVSFIKKGAGPKAEPITDGELYVRKIDCGSSLNGSAAIAELSVEQGNLLEIILQDVAKSFVPDSMMNEQELKRVRDGLPQAEKNNYYFAKSITLSTLTHRTLTTQKFKAKVSASWVTVGGETYKSAEEFSKERLISADMISLGRMVFLSDSVTQ